MPDQLELFRQLPPQDTRPGKQHYLLIAGHIVAYTLRRDRRRLAMRIDERGLSVGAPRSVTLAEIEAFIRGHGAWVLEKLAAFAAQGARRHLPIFDGARLPLLGGEVCVRVTHGANRGVWSEGELWLAARPDADLSALTRRALQRRALEHFRPRLVEMAARIGQMAPPLALSSARTRWGSCSLRSGIRLNWRLIHLAPATIDYVIAHEVAHLVEMNHSPRFWQVVERLYPDWRAARARLRQEGAALPLI
ncbi:M48 family metallopeptidase [Sulfuricystis thermophila]|uniref:M48 family metallopeptidase n=1 Tax=Sulfuricystis thermophila TaxID=2496847 RepID=UPI0010359EFC|nr:SprT family zinc-dependent metalloprotease [Sulfuricystis thermophila]